MLLIAKIKAYFVAKNHIQRSLLETFQEVKEIRVESASDGQTQYAISDLACAFSVS